MTYSHGSPQDRLAALREELAPYIGERVVSLLEAVAGDRGESDQNPDVTEAERLLLGWGRLAARGEPLDDDARARFEQTFSPGLRESLAEFVALLTS